LAPELRIEYDRLYAGLHGDNARREPSVELVLALLCDSEAERWTATRMFHDAGTLMRWGLLQRSPDSAFGHPSGLTQMVRLDPRITQFLLGDTRCDARLQTVARLVDTGAETGPVATDTDVGEIADMLLAWQYEPAPAAAPVVYLRGQADVDTADAAFHLCAAAGLPMLAADTHSLLASGIDQATALIRVLCREAVLQQCALYLGGADALLNDVARPALHVLRSAAADCGRPLILAGESFWTAVDFGRSVFRQISVRHPDVDSRRALWRRQLAGLEPANALWSDTLASQFVLTARQIRNATAVARQGRCTLDGLAAACRAESDQDIGELAVKVETRHRWADLVLPDDKIAQLREICDQIRHRHVVYGRWGFGDRLGHGIGISALFSGSPGTGKTVAAQVIAAEVGLPLYRIDLSGVVSKYIGETEKNLAKIFDRARAGNAVLFFDEADALFGKRTEVSDAHDRYANIETSYLLQKLEEHDGVVILATNLRANLDDAFTRRIRCIVEFPFPDAPLRQQIWKSHFPAQAPLAADVDVDYLAAAFPIAGGCISNVALGAAFLAAADGGTIKAEHVLAGARREYDKLGKLWAAPRPEPEVRS
jgi:ATP-dependent 26S proteasome regulatory subunit